MKTEQFNRAKEIIAQLSKIKSVNQAISHSNNNLRVTVRDSSSQILSVQELKEAIGETAYNEIMETTNSLFEIKINKVKDALEKEFNEL